MCSYCGCESIDLIGRFMAEHVAIVNALTDLRSACHAGDAEAVQTAVTQMERLLHPHTAAEEVGLCPVASAGGVRRDDRPAVRRAQRA
jgi:PleD family two-component response regulator